MPVNYNLVDPTEGMNRGLGTLAQALQYRQQMERQATQDAMTAKSHGLQNTLSQMGIDKITAEQGALMSATGQPDLQSALGAQLKAEMEGKAQKLQAEKLARYSTVLEHLSKAPFDDATKTEYLKAAIGKDPDFADFVKTMSIQSQPKASDYSVEKIYGPGGATKAVPVSKTGGYTPESGWSLAPPLNNSYNIPASEKGYLMSKFDLSTPDGEATALAHLRTPEGQRGLASYVKKAKQNMTVNMNVPQQTQFIDPVTQNPLIFDKATGSYKVANVVGGGVAAPRLVNPSAGEREKTALLDVLSEQLDRIEESYKPEYVGLVSGQIGKITQLIDSDEAAFRQVISDVKDSLLRARSGAQINEQEYKRLARLVPDMANSEAQFEGKMKAFKTTLKSLISQRRETQKEGGVYWRGAKPKTWEQLKKAKGW